VEDIAILAVAFMCVDVFVEMVDVDVVDDPATDNGDNVDATEGKDKVACVVVVSGVHVRVTHLHLLARFVEQSC
jgi:hypothetical protein